MILNIIALFVVSKEFSRKNKTKLQKFLWGAFALLNPVITIIVYLCSDKEKKKKKKKNEFEHYVGLALSIIEMIFVLLVIVFNVLML